MDIIDKSGDNLVINRETMFHNGGQINIDRMIIPTWGIHRFDATGHADGDKADARFDKTARNQGIPASFLSVVFHQARIFVPQIKRFAHTVSHEDIAGSPMEFVEGIDHTEGDQLTA